MSVCQASGRPGVRHEEDQDDAPGIRCMRCTLFSRVRVRHGEWGENRIADRAVFYIYRDYPGILIVLNFISEWDGMS